MAHRCRRALLAPSGALDSSTLTLLALVCAPSAITGLPTPLLLRSIILEAVDMRPEWQSAGKPVITLSGQVYVPSFRIANMS